MSVQLRNVHFSVVAFWQEGCDKGKGAIPKSAAAPRSSPHNIERLYSEEWMGSFNVEDEDICLWLEGE